MTRPAKGTPEYDLWLAALNIAVAAPLKQGTYSASAQIPWALINELRETVDAVGIDWRKVKTGGE